jgi:hypothetical protein
MRRSSQYTKKCLMKLPKKIRITSQVSYVVIVEKKLGKYRGEDELGICCPEKRTIFIKAGMSYSLTMRTLIHEVFHAIEFECDVAISHETIHRLEKPIFKMLKLNRWM